jgi:hypothetical protein
MHVLHNQHVRLVISGTGSVLELVCLDTGTHYIHTPGLPLWRVILADAESLVNPVTPNHQPCEVVHHGERVVITVPHLAYHYRGGMRATGVTLRISVELDVRAARWTVEVENHDPEVRVMEVWAPIINGLRPTPDWSLYFPRDCGLRLQNPVHTLGDRGAMLRFGVNNANLRELYPGKASMQWMGLFNHYEGLFYATEDRSLRTQCLNAERNFGAHANDDSLQLCIIRYPGLRQGHWKGATVVTALELGDWHAGARRYRAWADTWLRLPVPPDWVQRLPGLQDTILREQYGSRVYGYDEMPALAQAALEVGVPLAKFSGWHTAGHDNGYPDYDADPAQGGARGLADAVAAVQRTGARAMLYLQAVQMTRNAAFYAQHGPAVSMRDPYGDELADTFTWPGQSTFLPMSAQHQLVNACLSTREWQEQMLDRVSYLLDIGADCIYLDRLAGFPGYLCFSEEHPHEYPCEAYTDRVRLGMACREITKRRDPEIALASEYINDAGLQPFDFTIPFGAGVHYGGTNFGELFRYTFPEYIITTQYLNGAEYDRVKFGVVMGFRLFFAINWQHQPISATPPAFRHFVRDVIALLLAHADPFLTGHFIDTDGLHAVNPALVAKSYRSAGRFGVAVWNPTDAPQPLALRSEAPLTWTTLDDTVVDPLPPGGLALGVTV